MTTGWRFWRYTTYGSELWITEDEDMIHVWEKQDITAHIDANVAMANNGFDRKSEIWPTSSIPLSLINQWRNDPKNGFDYFNPDNEKIVKRILNDADYKKLRTAEHRV